MKKMFLLFLLLLAIPIAIIAQADSIVVNPGEPFTFDFNAWVATLSSIAAASVFLGGGIIKIFSVTDKIWKQVLVWAVSIVLTFLGNVFNIGFAADFPWLTTAVYGLAAGLVANGLFDITIVQAVLTFLKLKEKKV